MHHESRLEYLEGEAGGKRKEDCEEGDSTVAPNQTSIKVRTLWLALALGDGSQCCGLKNDCKKQGTGQDDHGRDSVGQFQNVGRLGSQDSGSQYRHAPNGQASDDECRRSRRDDNDRVVQGGMDPAVTFRVAARGRTGARTGARTVATAGRSRTQAAVAATSSKWTESSQPDNCTSIFNEAIEGTSRAHDAAASRANDEGRESLRTEASDVFEGCKPSSKKKRLAVPGGVVGRSASVATNVRGREPHFEETHAPRHATRAPESGIPSNVVVDVSRSSPFLQDDQASRSSWSKTCSAALVVISVVSAGVFVCMSFQVFSVVRTHGVLEEDWAVQNGTSESTADQAHRAASTTVATTTDDEDFQTAGDDDVE